MSRTGYSAASVRTTRRLASGPRRARSRLFLRRLAGPDSPGRGPLPLFWNFFVLGAPGVATADPGRLPSSYTLRSRGSATRQAIPDPYSPPVAPGRWNTLEHSGTLGTVVRGRPAGSGRSG